MTAVDQRIGTVRRGGGHGPLRRELGFVGLSALLCAGCFGIVWYQAYGVNQAIQLAYVNHWADPTLYRRDPFIATGAYYATVLWRWLAAAERVVPLGALLLGGTVVERMAAIYFAGLVARALVGASTLARVAAMVAVTVGPLPLLGAGTTLPDYLEQSGLATAVLLLAFACFVGRRYVAWAALVGAAANLNALYAAYAVAYCGAVFVVGRRPRSDLSRIAVAFPLMVACAVPILAGLHAAPPQAAFDAHLWWGAMVFRSAHHLFPLSWAPLRYAEYGVSMACLLAVGWLGRRRAEMTSNAGPPAEPELAGFAIAVAAVSVAAVGAAFFVAYAVHVPSLLKLQPVRATDLGYSLTAVALACFVARWVERMAAGPSRAMAVGVPLLLLTCLWPVLPVAALAAAIGAGSVAYWVGVRRSATVDPAARVRWATAACLVGLAVAAVARPALTRKYTKFNTGDRWEVSGAAAWAGRSTPKDAVFLLDADDGRTEPFRALAERSVFVQMKDGTALFYDFGYVDMWRARMNAAGYPLPDQKPLTPPYRQWRDGDAMALRARAGIDYWLVSAGWPTSLPVVWQDGQFKILDLRPASGR